MKYMAVNLGFSTADAESVRIEFDGSDLALSFVDWQERRIRHTFRDVLAHRWGQDLDAEGISDDQVYEVQDSPWLGQEAHLGAVDQAAYVHYKLCFNACGVLDVLAHRGDA